MTHINHETRPRIHDVLIRPLSTNDGVMELYRYQDHLLPRIGLVEYVELAPHDPGALRLRRQSDELWMLLDGSCTFLWNDRRSESPSNNIVQRFHTSQPTLVLVPFGVAFGVRTDRTARLIRLAEHDHSEDEGGEKYSWPDL